MIAALYVQTGGAYFGLEGVDPWDEQRDARLYAGPWPVVAHPPCKRWGRYARGGPNATPGKFRLGDDGGCFAAAFAAVNRWGGVIEHPAASWAWEAHGIATPPHAGGWVSAGLYAPPHGWTCCVEQGHYGHRARKATWLYCVNREQRPYPLIWGPADSGVRMEEGFRSNSERAAARRAGVPPIKRMNGSELAATPIPFRDLLLSLASNTGRTPRPDNNGELTE